LLVQEYTTEWQQAFQDAGLFVRYPYRVESPQDRWTGTAILSRVPLVETEVWEMAGTFATRAAIVRGDAAVSLYSVHPEPPLFPFSRHQAQWHALIRKVESDRGNRVVAGDLNVTPFNAWYSELKDTGLRNCHEDRGRGSATTWNVQHRWFPPIRLDNVFYSSGVSCLSIDEVTGHGTDHEIVVAEVALVGR
jgi:endonuclease/exonuclease/phosphatase (EEP) superfamily protein YafD